MKKSKNNERLVYGGIFIAFAAFLLYYLYISTDCMPLMDWWKGGIGQRIDAAMESLLPTWEELFPITHSLHSGPVGGLTRKIYLRVFKCDNRAYIYTGAVYLLLAIAFLLRFYKTHYSVADQKLNAVGAVVCLFPMLNLNQWEILTLWCSGGFYLRVLGFLLLFGIVDKLLHREKQVRMRAAVGTGVAGMLATLVIGSAYFPGYVAAVVAIVWLDFFLNRRGARVWQYLVITFFHIAGVVIYLVTLAKNIDSSAAENTGILSTLTMYVKGILVMLGSTLLPVTKFEGASAVCYIVGLLVFVAACGAVILFFYKKIDQETYFPLACMIYAFVSTVVIVTGRAGLGLGALRASRYVVETTLGLLGMVQIYWKSWTQKRQPGKPRGKRLCVETIVIGGVMVALLWSNCVEMRIGPYRKLYDQTMIELALNIDEATDEELEIFQASGADVREGVAAMKKYHLNLWQNEES